MTLVDSQFPQNVLIVGNADGIGLALAQALLEQHRNVIVAVPSPSPSPSPDEHEHEHEHEQVLEQYIQLGQAHDIGQALAYPIDLGKKSAFAQFVSTHIQPRIRNIDALICAVENFPLEPDFELIDEKTTNSAIQSGSWPLVAFLQALQRTLSFYPRYAIGTCWYEDSSSSFDHAYQGISLSVLETLCRYIASHLRHDHVLANLLCFRRNHGNDPFTITPDCAAKSILALCSGRFDALSGQILKFDSGYSLQSTSPQGPTIYSK